MECEREEEIPPVPISTGLLRKSIAKNDSKSISDQTMITARGSGGKTGGNSRNRQQINHKAGRPAGAEAERAGPLN